MPQFDLASYSVQIFWFVLSTLLLYLIYTKHLITKSSSILKMREKLKTISSFNKDKPKTLGYYDLVFHGPIFKFFKNKRTTIL